MPRTPQLLAQLVGVLPLAAGAQTWHPAADVRPVAPRHSHRAVEVWAGGSTRSPALGVLGRIRDQRLTLVAGRLTRQLVASRAVALDYTVDVVPVVLLSPPVQRTVPAGPICPHGPRCVGNGIGVRTGGAHGVGASPLGITAVLRPASALQLRLGATGGVLWFDRAVPTTAATRLNFTAAAEAGVQLVDRRDRGVLVVYRFHHLSNAGTGAENPGIASHVLSLGARWRLGHR